MWFYSLYWWTTFKNRAGYLIHRHQCVISVTQVTLHVRSRVMLMKLTLLWVILHFSVLGGGLAVRCDPCWSAAMLPWLCDRGKLEHSSEPQAEIPVLTGTCGEMGLAVGCLTENFMEGGPVSQWWLVLILLFTLTSCHSCPCRSDYFLPKYQQPDQWHLNMKQRLHATTCMGWMAILDVNHFWSSISSFSLSNKH